MPPEALAQMREDPWWETAEALAPTIAYDSQVMGTSGGGTVPADLLARVQRPRRGPRGRGEPEGQGHVVVPELIAPVVAEFLRPAAG
jgi:hypothetical protein